MSLGDSYEDGAHLGHFVCHLSRGGTSLGSGLKARVKFRLTVKKTFGSRLDKANFIQLEVGSSLKIPVDVLKKLMLGVDVLRVSIKPN